MRLVRRVEIPAQLIGRDAKLCSDVIEVLGNCRRVVGRFRELSQRLVTCHLFGNNEARKLHPPRIIAKLFRKPIALDEARETRFEVLLRIWLPSKLFYKQLEMGISAAYQLAGQTMACNMMEDSAQEGFQAFLDKRKPNWSAG